MSSSDQNNNINDLPAEEFKQRLEMAAQMYFLKKRIERLEEEQNDTPAMLARMWNTAITWIIPRYFDPKK